MAELSLTRRRFLEATGWTAAGITVLYLGGRRLLSVLPSFDTPGQDGGAAWLQILPDGRCRMLSPRAEMGQNASIGLAQLAAEELNLGDRAAERHVHDSLGGIAMRRSDRGDGRDLRRHLLARVRGAAQAQTPAGTEFQVNAYTTGSQTSPAVAMDGDGDFVVVWMSYGSPGTDTNNSSLQGQRFASDGSALGAQFQVNTYTTFHQGGTSVAVDAQGDIVVVWHSSGSFGTDDWYSIQAQRYASDGSPMGGQFQVNTYTTNIQSSPAVAAADDGDFVVVWQSQGSFGTDYSDSIQAQRYASGGSPLGSQFQVNTFRQSDQNDPSVDAAADGSFVVVWSSRGTYGTDEQYGSGYSIQGQRFAPDGSKRGAEFQVNTYTPSDQRAPSVAVDQDGDFVVVWHDRSYSGTDLSATGVEGQRYASDGSPRGGQFQVNSYTPGYQDFASVTASPAGDFVVAWQGHTSATDTSGRTIRAQRYTSGGSPRGVEFQVNTGTAGDQLRPAVAAAADGDFVVVWDSLVSSGTDTSFDSVQGQRFRALPIPVPALSRTVSFALGGVLLLLGAVLSHQHQRATSARRSPR